MSCVYMAGPPLPPPPPASELDGMTLAIYLKEITQTHREATIILLVK